MAWLGGLMPEEEILCLLPAETSWVRRHSGALAQPMLTV
ncbi:hypothetical protein FHT80_002085 [Rhizobium sp. BK226]|nr:hypothetical protein [Rhizobium sp. BK226]